MTGRIIILVFAFGSYENIRPNRLIADRATYLSLPGCADIFTQKDVPLDRINPIFAENITAKKDYLSTLDVIKTFVNWITVSSIRGEGGGISVYVVAAPQHQWRCCRDLKKVLKEHGLTMKMFIDIDDKPEEDMYDKYSSQWWTRSWWQWWLHEIPLRLMPWWLYKKIA